MASVKIAEAMDEAFERAGIDPLTLTIRHVYSARRSMELMLKHWSNLALFQWSIELQQQTLVQGAPSFVLPVGSLDILTATLSRDDAETEMSVWSRQEYHIFPKKDHAGRPDRFYVQRNRDSVTCFVWPVSEFDTDIMYYYRIRALQDGGAASDNPDIPQRYYDAFCADWAARIAEKFAPERYDALQARFASKFIAAKNEDRERAPTRIRPRLR